ncbi:MAG: AarF/ABC1/UbiB kinase family protein [Halioglobus sp.]|nr:AarF/ABC1/UbiB kinase family protein [Halioglobus sp.]
MAKKHRGLKGNTLPRALSVSLAGIRAGGALAVDSVVQRVIGQGNVDEDSGFARREARHFVKELGKLKGTYIKIGQMLALFGEHFLPSALVDALHDLSDQTEPLHWDALETSVRDSLGEHYVELDIEPEAIAAASLAQVHLARVRATGEQICLKIQYPGLSQVIDADFDAVVRMLLLARWVKAGRALDDWLESMRVHLHNEIDYRREVHFTDRVGALVTDIEEPAVLYSVPSLYRRYCTDAVIAMEYIKGMPVSDPLVSALSQERRNALARGMLELFFQEVYQWGLLQTDPNFGNYLLRLGDRRKRVAEDDLVLLDFGSVLECQQDFLYHLRQTIAAGQRQDGQGLAAGLVGLGCLHEDASEEGRGLFTDFCLNLLEPLRKPDHLPPEYLNARGEYCWARSQLMRRVGKQAALSTTSRHFTTPSRDFALIARKLTGVYNFIAALDAEFNAYEMVESHIRRWQEREAHGAQV